jgi:hypothetical protein
MTTMDRATGVTPTWVSLLSLAIGLLYLLYHAVLSAALYANARVRTKATTSKGWCQPLSVLPDRRMLSTAGYWLETPGKVLHVAASQREFRESLPA